jgi:hypothetical protein
MIFFLKRVFYFVKDNWLIVVVSAAVLILTVFVYRACNKPAKLNEEEIQQGEKAVEEKNDKKLREVLANYDVRQQGIDSNIKAAEEATEKAKRSYANMNTQELADELERRKNQ